MINYYHILGISQKASQSEIKAAYRKLALQYHPDKNPGSRYAEERFKEISHAYSILRDPDQKARHDLALSYEELHRQLKKNTYASTPFGTPTNTANTTGRQRQAYRRPYRSMAGTPFYTTPPVSKRQNLIATAWAFGIFFMIVLLVVGLSSYRTYQEERFIAEQQELALEVYQRAEQSFKQENYRHALQLLQTIDQQYRIPYSASLLKEQILRRVIEQANKYFEQQAYTKAAELFQLLADYEAYNPYTYAKLVSAYEMIPNYEQAIRAYQEIIEQDPGTIEARNRLGALFIKDHQYDQALKYYQEAIEIVIREYEQKYGKGYALALNPAKTPESHYQLHCGMGRAYTHLGLYKQADRALKWAIFLRPDEPEAYLLLGQNSFDMNEVSQACKAWQEAKEKGSETAAGLLKKHCR